MSQGRTGQNVLPVPESLASKVDTLQEYLKQESLLNKERHTFSCLQFEKIDVRFVTLGGAIQNVNAFAPGDGIEPVPVLNDSGQHEVPQFFPLRVFETWSLLKKRNAYKLVSLLRAYNFRVHKPMDHDAGGDDTSSEDTTSSTPTLEDFARDHQYEAWCQLLGRLHMDGPKIYHAMQVSKKKAFLVADELRVSREKKRAANHEDPEESGRLTRTKITHTPAPPSVSPTPQDRSILYAGTTEFPDQLSSSPRSKHTILGYKNPNSPSSAYGQLRDLTESPIAHHPKKTSSKGASPTQRLSEYDRQEKLKARG